MKSIAFALMMVMVGTVDAAEYYDYLNSTHIEITDGVVEAGEEIEYYNWNSGSYHYGEVTGVDSDGDVEVIEYDSGRIRYLEEQ